MRTVNTDHGNRRDYKPNTTMDIMDRRMTENAPAFAYHNNLMADSFRRTEMVEALSQKQRDLYQRQQHLKTSNQHLHEN